MGDSAEGYRDGHYYLFSYSPGVNGGELHGIWNGIHKRHTGVTMDAWLSLKRRLTSVPADAAALPAAKAQAQSEPTAVTGGTAEHHR